MSIEARNKDCEMQNKALNRKGAGGTEPRDGAEKEEMENVVVAAKTSSPSDDDISPPPPISFLPPPPPKKAPGGWRSVKYILGN